MTANLYFQLKYFSSFLFFSLSFVCSRLCLCEKKGHKFVRIRAYCFHVGKTFLGENQRVNNT